MAFAQAGMNARAFGEAVSLATLAAAFVSAPSVATAVLDLDALLDDLGARPISAIDFGTMPGGMFGAPLDERAASAWTAVEREVAAEPDESVRPARVLRIFADADPDLQAILERHDLTRETLLGPDPS